jgi:hypothetical protein
MSPRFLILKYTKIPQWTFCQVRVFFRFLGIFLYYFWVFLHFLRRFLLFKGDFDFITFKIKILPKPPYYFTKPNLFIEKGFYIVSTEIYDFNQIENQLEKYQLKSGGIWKPPNTIQMSSQLRIAIIVPYRDRLENLKIFLSNIHPFLMRQNVHYGIYLIEPMDTIRKVSFNRGLLANIGFLESLKDDTNKWNCFFIHDVDLIPENNLNFYKCDQDYPLQFAILLKQFDYVPKV